MSDKVAARIVLETGRTCRVSNRTLASYLKRIVGDFRSASEGASWSGEAVVRPIEAALGHVGAIKDMLSTELGRAHLIILDDKRVFRKEVAALERQLRQRLDWMREHFAELERRRGEMDGSAADAPTPEAVLMCEDLPALFDLCFGRVRRGEERGAKDRFIRAVCKAIGITPRTGDTLKRYCGRSRAAARRKDKGDE